MSDQDVEGKFHRLAGKYFSKTQREKVLRALWELDKVKDVSGILSSFIVS